MKSKTTLISTLFLLLPVLAQAQIGVKTSSATPATSAPLSYSHERNNDICTTAPRSEWLAEDEMKLLAQHRGYRIKTFKISKTSCYEVYGFDREGRIVEAYFNPVTTRLVRLNIAR